MKNINLVWHNFHEILPHVRKELYELEEDLVRFTAAVRTNNSKIKRLVGNKILKSLTTNQVSKIENIINAKLKIIIIDSKIVENIKLNVNEIEKLDFKNSRDFVIYRNKNSIDVTMIY